MPGGAQRPRHRHDHCSRPDRLGLGIDPSVLINGAQILTGGGAVTTQPTQAPQVERRYRPTDATGAFRRRWCSATPRIAGPKSSAASGRTYHPPKLRLFSGSEPGACGFAQSAMGPFYCPRDQRVYLDTSFFDDLQNKFGGCSDSKACQFSEAYVIAHEVGHHVQDELGILPRVTQAQQAASSQGRGERAAGAHRIAGRLLSPAFGRTAPSRSTTSSIRATSIRPCRPRPRSATTACRRRRRAMWCPTPSPTAPRRSASAGS